jgi:glycosyltransferase involved in cell wall biosynthesis
MNLIIAGHSCSHYRQRMLGEAIAKQGVRTVVVGPQQWGTEKYISYKKKGFDFRAFPIEGPSSFYTFTIKKISRIISGFRPAVVYCMEEPFTLFAHETMRYAKEFGCPFMFFTWENRPDYRLSESLSRIEQDVVMGSDMIICGNKLAVKRMANVGASSEKIRVLLQTGVDTELFRPMSEISKKFDIIYHGRLVREKGLPFLENVCRELKLSLLTVGGRGTYHIRYGDSFDWVNYEDLPKFINQARVGVQIPFSFQGYQEQGNYSVAENMSCCNPVVISDNGSLPDNYKDAPVPMVPEGDETALKLEICKILAGDETKRLKLGEYCRKWVIENLSLEAMGKKLLNILEEIR